MATAKRVFNQIEINFWNTAIPLLSDTPELRQIVRFVGSLITKYRKLPVLMRRAMWASAGWFVGFALSVFGSLIFS